MQTTTAPSEPGNVARALLLGAGLVFAAFAVAYNELSLGLLGLASDVSPSDVRSVQLVALLTGGGLIALSECVRRVRGIGARLKHPVAANWLLSALAFALPLVLLELALRPFAAISEPLTTIFLRDDELGWRLKPNAEDLWGNVRVRVNGKGLRGPELDYAKPSGVSRILYLGDSVAFGFMIQRWEQTFPHLVQEQLGRWGYSVETVNAGVGGYSPWQEYLFLAREGVRYDPDLVVISFVLNDVTEKFGLIRFGGTGEGWQLRRSALGVLDRVSTRSSIAHFARDLGQRLRFGGDVQKGAVRRDLLNVRAIAEKPDRANVRQAWNITLENLQKIFAFCEEREIPVLLVSFPYRFQFEDVAGLSAPQRVLNRYATAQGIPHIDLLPILSEQLKTPGLSPYTIYLGENHLSPIGGRLVAQIIATYLHEQGMLDRRVGGPAAPGARSSAGGGTITHRAP